MESFGVGGLGGQSMCVDACAAYEKQTSKEAKMITKYIQKDIETWPVYKCVCECVQRLAHE